MPDAMKREIGLPGAVLLGLGSILGTGIFVSIGLAAGIAGSWVVVAVLLAAGVACCNALSSAQLAAAHPVSGGTYEYAHRLLHPAAGFLAGWMFLLAKSASAATAALGFAGYTLALLGWSEEPRVPVAFVTVLVFTGITLAGIRRSSTVNAAIVGLTVLALLFFSVAGLWFQTTNPRAAGFDPVLSGTEALLHATALMFVAYTGYGRVATLAEEVREPRRTIPRAIIATLGVSAAIYLLVSVAAVGAVGPDFLAEATTGKAAPLELAAREFSVPGLAIVVALGAAAAMLGVLLNLILGLSRVLLAMGRRGEMPRALGRLDSKGATPAVAVLVTGALVAGLTLAGSVKTTWSFSAFTVLVYYAITNASAMALPREQRLFPHWIAWAGLGSCGFLAFWVEPRIWLAGLVLAVVGLGWHSAVRRINSPRTD